VRGRALCIGGTDLADRLRQVAGYDVLDEAAAAAGAHVVVVSGAEDVRAHAGAIALHCPAATGVVATDEAATDAAALLADTMFSPSRVLGAAGADEAEAVARAVLDDTGAACDVLLAGPQGYVPGRARVGRAGALALA
jgi:hypothetical protein